MLLLFELPVLNKATIVSYVCGVNIGVREKEQEEILPHFTKIRLFAELLLRLANLVVSIS